MTAAQRVIPGFGLGYCRDRYGPGRGMREICHISIISIYTRVRRMLIAVGRVFAVFVRRCCASEMVITMLILCYENVRFYC